MFIRNKGKQKLSDKESTYSGFDCIFPGIEVYWKGRGGGKVGGG